MLYNYFSADDVEQQSFQIIYRRGWGIKYVIKWPYIIVYEEALEAFSYIVIILLRDFLSLSSKKKKNQVQRYYQFWALSF